MSDLGKLRISVFIDPQQAAQQGATSGKAAGQKFTATLNYSVKEGTKGIQSSMKAALLTLEQQVASQGKVTGQAFVSNLKSSMGGLKSLISNGSINEIKKQLSQVTKAAEAEFNKLQGTKKLQLQVGYQLLSNAMLKGDFATIEKEIKHINNLLNDVAEDTRTNFRKAFDGLKSGLGTSSISELKKQLKSLSVAAESEMNKLDRIRTINIQFELQKLNQAQITGDFKAVEQSIANIFKELDGVVENTQSKFEKLFSSLKGSVGTSSVSSLQSQIAQTISAAEAQFNTLSPQKAQAVQSRLASIGTVTNAGDFNKLKAELQKLSAELGREGTTAGQKFKQSFISAIQGIGGSFRSVFGSLGDAIKGISGSILNGIGMTIGFSILNGIQNAISSGIGAVINGIKDVVETGTNLESLKYNLVFASGSSEEAATNFKFLTDNSNKLYQELIPTIEAFNKFGTSARLAGASGDEVRQVFASMTQAATVFRLTEDQQAGMFLALKQMFDKGKITAEEFTQQLGERIPAAVGAMVRATNSANPQELFEKMRAGVLDAKTYLPKFAEEMDKITESGLKFAQVGAAFQDQRFAKAFETLRIQAANAILPAVEAIKRTMADVVEEAVKSTDGFGELRDTAEEFRQELQGNPQIVKTLAKALEELVNASMQTAVDLATDLTEYLQKNPDAVAEMIDSFKQFLTLLGDALNLAGQLAAKLLDAAEGVKITLQGLGNYSNQQFANNAGVSEATQAGLRAAAVAQVEKEFELNDGPVDRLLAPIVRASARYSQRVEEVYNQLLQDQIQRQGVTNRQQMSTGVDNPVIQSLLDTIAVTEGTDYGEQYNILLGSTESNPKTFSDYSQHPRIRVPSLNSDAAGRYQFLGTTFDGYAEQLGLTDFSPRSQDLAATELMRTYANMGSDGLWERVLQGNEDAIRELIDILGRNRQWDSFPTAHHPWGTMDEVMNVFRTALSERTNSSSAYPDPILDTNYSDPNQVVSAPAAPAAPAYASPLANASMDEALSYLDQLTPDSGQDFTSYRNRSSGPDAHLGVDFDSRVNAGQGAPVQATQAGVATWETWGQSANGPSVAVRVRFTDANGNEIEQSYGHLDGASVMQALGVGEGVPVDVQMGQLLGNVGATDNLSSGPHLDFKVSINGQKVDPHQYLQALTDGGGTARTFEGAALPVANPGENEADPNAIFNVMDEAEQRRLQIIQETKANQDAALQLQRQQEDQAREAQRAQQQLELDARLQRYQGTSMEPFAAFSQQNFDVTTQYEDKAIELQRQLADLQTELTDIQQNRMDEGGIQTYLDQVQSAITQTEELINTNDALKSQALENLKQERAGVLADLKAQQEERQAQELADAQASLGSAMYDQSLAGIENPTVKALMEISQQSAVTANDFNSRIATMQQAISDLVDEMGLITEAGGDINSDEAAFLTDQIEHQTDLLTMLEEEKSIRMDLIELQRQQVMTDFSNELTSNLQSAQVTALQNRGDTWGANALQRQFASQQEAARYSQDLASISAFRQQGMPLDQIGQLTSQAALLNQVNLENINSQFKTLGETITEGAGKAFGDFFSSVISGTASIEDAFKNLLSSILDQLMQFLSDMVFQQIMGLFNPSSSPTEGLFGGGGIFQSILGIGTSLFGGGVGTLSGFTGDTVMNTALSALTPFAEGGLVRGPVASLIGESGPELIVPLDRVEGMFGGGGQLNINIPINVNNSGSGDVDPSALKRVIENQIQSTILKESRPGGSLNRSGRGR